MRTCHIFKTYLRVAVKLSANFFNGLVAQDVHRVLFCLHHTTEHTQKLRHGRVDQPGPRQKLKIGLELTETEP